MSGAGSAIESLELAWLVELGEGEACADMLRAAAPFLGTRVERIGAATPCWRRRFPSSCSTG